jgi:chaperonin GroES
MNIQPIGNRVLVELAKQAKTTASGFIISTEDKTEQQKGIITAVGKGFGEEKDLMSEFQVGQNVLFGRYGGEEVKNDSGEVTHKIINAKDIFGIINN